MDLTQEQLDAIITAVLTKAKIDLMRDIIVKKDLEGFATKEEVRTIAIDVANVIASLKTDLSKDIAKTNEAVTKVASETETKIKELRTTPAEVKGWWNRDII